MREREGSDKRKQGLCVWAVQSSVGIGADLWERSVRAISVYPCVCTGIMRRVVSCAVARDEVVHRRILCMAGYIYTALSGWWRGGCVKFWVAAY